MDTTESLLGPLEGLDFLEIFVSTRGGAARSDRRERVRADKQVCTGGSQENFASGSRDLGESLVIGISE